MDYWIKVGGIDANLAPDAFRRWATHYYECKQQFQCAHPFSPVPYFLLCRAIELGIKARHLQHDTQKQVKAKFGHDLVKAYNALDQKEKILSVPKFNVLKKASSIYYTKGFEYFKPRMLLLGSRGIPIYSY